MGRPVLQFAIRSLDSTYATTEYGQGLRISIRHNSCRLWGRSGLWFARSFDPKSKTTSLRGNTWLSLGMYFRYPPKRRLVFTESQAYFQCWNMHCCESTPLWLEEAHTKGLKRFKESVHTLRVFPSKGIGKTGNEIGARIQEYIRRNLSQDSDALNAFLRIFQAFRELQHPIYHHWGLPLSKGRSMKQELEGLHTSFLSSLAWSMSSCDNSSAHLLTRRDMFPSLSWVACKGLSDFSQKSIAENLYSPSVSFRTYRGQLVGLEEFKITLGRRDSTVVFDPCVYLAS
jgi:hypothetical protein